eukprot:CAMPEP_0181133618 /NCGR_PEP_ID=MMETSP1071-20121207/31623_1 /TAXON_ID=35127 /ORGANISM="Thalassiosira sp., Strain NH16" /LENGTH=174 /DNA_ID=CAMNT_0023220027 /DNA_START=72 /DNA_END=596 /DNA_ORIENTATION=-
MASCSPGETEAIVSKSSRKRKLVSESPAAQSIQQITSTDIYRSLQDTITQNFGLVGASTTELQVRLYDPKVRLAIIKTTRDKYPSVRSSLTVMTQIKQGGDVLKVVATTIAVSGSARTARNAAWQEIQKRFFAKQRSDDFGKAKGEPWSKRSRISMEKDLKALEDRMEKIDSGC